MYSVIASFPNCDAAAVRAALKGVHGIECLLVSDRIIAIDADSFLSAFEAGKYVVGSWQKPFAVMFSSVEVGSIMMGSIFKEFESHCTQGGFFAISDGLGMLTPIAKRAGFKVASTTLSLLGSPRTVLALPSTGDTDFENLSLRLAGSNFLLPENSFVGRGNLIDKTWGEIWGRQHVCLTGCGGIGKTRLAKEIATYATQSGCPKVSLLSLSEHRTNAQARNALLHLKAILLLRSENRELVVIDNCEHVLDAVYHFLNESDFSDIAARFLLTSREEISFPGIINRSVPGLTVPDDEQMEQGFFGCESVALLEDRLLAVRESGLSETELPIAALLTRLVSGLPLAIEQIASHLDKLSLSDAYDQLAAKLQDLQFAREHHEARHQTMLRTMEWSFDLLNANEVEVLGVCASFEGSFKPEHVRTFTGMSGTPQMLRALEKKSLVKRSNERETSSPYEIVQCVRDCARVSLPGAIIRPTALAEFCLAIIYDSFDDSEGNQSLWRIEDMRILHRTIEVGLDYLSDTNDTRLPGALSKAYRYYTSAGKPSQLLPYFARIIEALPPDHPEYMSILNGKAQLEWHSGDIDQARTSLGMLSRMAVEYGDQIQAATALSNLAVLELNHGDAELAEAPLREAREIFFANGENSRYWATTANLVYISVVNGRQDEFLALARNIVGAVETDIPAHILPVLYINFADIFELANDQEGGREYCLRHILEASMLDAATHSFEPALLRMIPTVFKRNAQDAAFLYGMLHEYLAEGENAGRKLFLERHDDIFSEMESGEYQESIIAGNFVDYNSKATEAFRRAFPS